jgi:hypothetical protein
VSLGDRELVEEHLRSLVGVGHLHPGDESDRRHAAAIQRDKEVVALLRKEPLDPAVERNRVEKVRAITCDLHVSGGEVHDFHRSIVRARRIAACSAKSSPRS